MSFGQFKRQPQRPPVPQNISPLYDHLYDDILGDSELSPGAKTVIFCIAYTLYSLEKKDDIAIALRAKTPPNDNIIAKSFEKFLTTPGKKSDIIREAKTLADIYKQELTTLAFAVVTKRIDAILDSQALIGTKIDTSVQTQERLIQSGERFSLKGFRNHFGYAAITGFIASGITAGIAYVAAHPEETLHFIEHAFGHLKLFQ